MDFLGGGLRDKVVVGNGKARKATVTLTAEDWQLYTGSMDCSGVAAELNAALAGAVSSGMDAKAAHAAVAAVMETRSEYGAYDTEPRGVLADALVIAYGPRPAVGYAGDATAKAEELREFFRSDETVAFLGEHCAGERPWALVMDAERRVVLASPDRDAFYVVAPTPHGFDAFMASDPIAVIDPESESAEPLGSFEDPSAAFEAVTRHAGLSAAPTP